MATIFAYFCCLLKYVHLIGCRGVCVGSTCVCVGSSCVWQDSDESLNESLSWGEHFLQVLHISCWALLQFLSIPFFPFLSVPYLFMIPFSPYSWFYSLFTALRPLFCSPSLLIICLCWGSLWLCAASLSLCNSGIYSCSPIHWEGETHKWLKIKFELLWKCDRARFRADCSSLEESKKVPRITSLWWQQWGHKCFPVGYRTLSIYQSNTQHFYNRGYNESQTQRRPWNGSCDRFRCISEWNGFLKRKKCRARHLYSWWNGITFPRWECVGLCINSYYILKYYKIHIK